MNVSLLLVILFASYSCVTLVYVYRFRGHTRYKNLNQFLRKSWPIFAPFNCLLYMATHSAARKPVLDTDFLKDFELLRSNWETIRNEALSIQSNGMFDLVKSPGAVGYFDVGFRTFYKRGWSKFYLKWYGTTHVSAQRLCPATVALINQIPAIQGAMFSVLPPDSELTIHSDPLACSMRYHLGLDTPNSDDCFIVVDSEKCIWRNGEDFMFDETYPHYAKNRSEQQRVILMCDINRPMNTCGKAINSVYRLIAKCTLVPNTSEDKKGVFNILFSFFAPFQLRSQQLKIARPKLYKTLKLMLNSGLIAIFVTLLYGTGRAIEKLLLF
ncbi:hypothetical protein TDB9533_00739 [Thalassocella blandensis]|nr:hypothetical protein TDB9533_00739 [Thalassocella blandensis]